MAGYKIYTQKAVTFLSTYIKNGKNTYGAKLGDQQQVELRREKKYLSHE